MSTQRTIAVSLSRPYAAIPKDILTDTTLSIAARLTLAWALGQPDDWIFHLTHVAKAIGMGRDKTEAVFRELIAHGYVTRTGQTRHNGKWKHAQYKIHDTPCGKSTAPGKPGPRNQGAETRALTKLDRQRVSKIKNVPEFAAVEKQHGNTFLWVSQLDYRWPYLSQMRTAPAVDRRGGWTFTTEELDAATALHARYKTDPPTHQDGAQGQPSRARRHQA